MRSNFFSMVNEEHFCDLLQRASKGNKPAFAEFCMLALPVLLKIQKARCRRYAIPLDLADDFVQETLLQAAKWVTKQRDVKGSGFHFLSMISRNVVIDWL